MEHTSKKRKTVYIMSGCPGSGKSTWIAKQMRPKTDICISRDNIRFGLLKNEEDYFAHENEVKKIFFNAIKQYTITDKVYENIFIDATHLTPRIRKNIQQLIGPDAYIIGVDFNINIPILLERNNQRTGRAKVPEAVIRRMYGQYVTPTISEGFDEVWHIDAEGVITKEVRIYE